MANALEQEMSKYFMQLDEADKKSVLQLIKTFIQKKKTGHKDASTIAAYNKELDEAMERINKGEFTTLDELDKEMQLW
ncbi:MAG: hypothetical protein J7621_01430 [Niastella sp.]|nr:hypothetical protein [Niastella sp.]